MCGFRGLSSTRDERVAVIVENVVPYIYIAAAVVNNCMGNKYSVLATTT